MNDTPIVSPQKFIAYLKQTGRLTSVNPPRIVIIIFLESLLTLCQKHYSLKKVEGFDAGDLYLFEQNESIAIFYCKGIGAPVAVINFEELIAFGVKEFLVVGTAGSLQPALQVGEIVLCNKAIVDEGTSKHYIENSLLASPLPAWHDQFKRYLANANISLIEGTSWTTDAPYRETQEKVIAMQNQHVLCVEMEMSALFTVAAFYQISISAAFVISDSLADLTWTPGFFSSKVMDSLFKLLTVAIQFADDSASSKKISIETVATHI